MCTPGRLWAGGARRKTLEMAPGLELPLDKETGGFEWAFPGCQCRWLGSNSGLMKSTRTKLMSKKPIIFEKKKLFLR